MRLGSRFTAIALLACLWGGSSAGALLAQEGSDPSFLYDSVTILPAEGSVLEWNGRNYAGAMEVRAVDGGLVLIETLTIDDYLLGIQEVPFSWEPDALRAQAVAARTYLAWTLSLGRNGAAATYGFDICATDQCQVYGGIDQVAGDGGERWKAAVEDTAAEVLLHDGRPAQALYSSTSGGRTRSVQDVFGSTPVPYLVAVPSPNETSPFVEWTVELSGPAFENVLADADLIAGRLELVEVVTTRDGDGPWVVEIVSDGGTNSLSTWQFRRELNRSGPRVLPDRLPAERPDGGRYPQTILSPTYDVVREWRISNDFTAGYIEAIPIYRIVGNGWGHLVGMSQYGAQAMATAGASYADILAHYYGGLEPQPGGSVLPETVEVGLIWGEPIIRLGASGPFDVVADEELLQPEALGTWRFEANGDDVVVVAPDGRGFPPRFREVAERSEHLAGRVVQVTGTLSAAAETRMSIFRGPELVAQTEWTVRDPGLVAFVWDGSIDGELAPPGPYRVVLSARSADGSAAAIATAVILP